MKNFTTVILGLTILFLSDKVCYAGCHTQYYGYGLIQVSPQQDIKTGVPFFDTCQFLNAAQGGNDYNDIIDVDSITGFPDGISTSSASGSISQGDCSFFVYFSGTTNAHPGNYPLTIWGQLYHNGTPLGHGNLQTEFNTGDSLGWWSEENLTFNLVIACYPIATPTISGGTDTVALHNTVSYSTPLRAGYTYQWQAFNGTITSGLNTNTITVSWDTLGNGYLQLFVVDTFGCYNDTALNVFIDNASGISPVSVSRMSVYPNPAKDRLQINLYKPTTITLTNILGETVMERKLETSAYLDISALTPGVYLIYDRLAGTTVKFIKE